MPTQPRLLRSAPVLDLLCVMTFVAIGGRSHGVGEGLGWFLGVMWPLCVGIFGVALLVHLYTCTTRMWRALTITLLGGLVIAQVLRGAVMDDPWISAFFVVACTYLGLTMFGWRVVATLVARRRGRAAAAAAARG